MIYDTYRSQRRFDSSWREVLEGGFGADFGGCPAAGVGHMVTCPRSCTDLRTIIRAACNTVVAMGHKKHDDTEGPPMKNAGSFPISVLALMLAAPAFANTPASNIAWSAKPVQATA
ncbi:hypothetical protein [Burkholderia aenigmatica]|uniref:hypothetical protein n=1 Tax=Burkholderia aenigmatica TaxID=2015348 RepID=UPI0026509166|nr:hypothetical protein [Burkholderia aenigmatica]MDN7877483.1 hypothetical protein [Burkholderia aenigmatica]